MYDVGWASAFMVTGNSSASTIQLVRIVWLRRSSLANGEIVLRYMEGLWKVECAAYLKMRC